MKERATPAVFAEFHPTAWQDVAETQDTLSSWLIPNGRISSDQVEPLNERATAVFVEPWPTA